MKRKRYSRGTPFLTIKIEDGEGWFYKKKGPLRETLPDALSYIREGLQIEIPIERRKNGRRKSRHR